MLYTIIYDFMWKDLRLRGAEKEVFAVIYGFWKKGKATVEIPIQTVMAITGLSRTSVIMAKRALLKKELVAAQEIRGKPTRYEVLIPGYTILSGNSAYKSSIISRDLTPARIQETWEKMRPENRYGQMTYEERLAFATSDEGKDYLFPLGLTLDGKRYETKASGGAVKAFHEESRAIERTHSPEEAGNIFRTAFLLFAGYVDAATSFAQNCGGGGSAPDQNWGRDKNEDDILWAHRCFRKAREMVTTPVIKWGRRR